MTNAAAQLADLAERYWRFECHETPLSAVLAGQTLPDAVLFRESQADHARRNGIAGELLASLHGIAPTGLSAQERATHRLLQRELAGIREQHAVHAQLRPSLFPAGPDFTAIFWANSTNIGDLTAAERYVDCLAGLPAYLADMQANIAAGHAMGLRYPRAVLDGAASNTRNILAAAPETSAWMGPFRRSPLATQAALQAQAEAALALVRNTLQPALQAWTAFLSGLPGRDSLACTDDPQGREFYRVLVRHFTTTELSPEQIHELGLQQVTRLQGEMNAVAAQAGYANDLAGYRAFLSGDAQFVAASAEALRKDIESLCKRIDKRIPTFFGRIPRITYGVDSMPQALSLQMPPAYAQPSPGDGSAPGIFWVSGLPAKCPSYLHVALALHEAWPGHLMHLALMNEQADLPAFRRFGAVKYTACVEGWALYCETLGIEMGLYDTPHQQYGRLEMEMWRAVRLVVDTGIHWYGWNRQRAIDYMHERLSLSLETLAGEVDRYAALPAQALAYQIGNLKLRELRSRAETVLGPRFRHRDFHTAVTTVGAVTLPVLDELVGNWLDSLSA